MGMRVTQLSYCGLHDDTDQRGNSNRFKKGILKNMFISNKKMIEFMMN